MHEAEVLALMHLQCGRFRFSLARPLIMGVVNVTPDSFFDGGQFLSVQAALARARRLLDEGADIVDIGGESTRPGAAEVAFDEERRRVLPVLERLSAENMPVSVDTQKPALMREAIAAGAAMINDVNALQTPGAVEAVAAGDVGVCVMHKQGVPLDMQLQPRYDDVVSEVREFLARRVVVMCEAGIQSERIVIDPGFGFGKSLEHNLELLRALACLKMPHIAMLAGMSRKSMLGRITGRDVGERLHASVAAALIAVQNGANIVRVHDVAATRDALAVWEAVRQS